MSTEWKKLNLLAKNLMTFIYADGKLTIEEIEAQIELVNELDKELSCKNRKCLICGGHDTISVLSGAI